MLIAMVTGWFMGFVLVFIAVSALVVTVGAIAAVLVSVCFWIKDGETKW